MRNYRDSGLDGSSKLSFMEFHIKMIYEDRDRFFVSVNIYAETIYCKLNLIIFSLPFSQSPQVYKSVGRE